MNATVYAFEAKEIQAYILDRTRMRERVGASGLIDAIGDEVLGAALKALQLAENTDYQYCRLGGGGFTLLMNTLEQANALRDLISLIMPQWAPELPFVHTVQEARTTALDAMERAAIELKILIHQPTASLPVAGPITERSRYTGLPASTKNKKSEFQDRAAAAKEKYSRNHRDQLGTKFLRPEAMESLQHQWPIDLNPKEGEPDDPVPTFPYRSDSRYLGILHIDGNGFGQALISLRTAIRDRPNYAQIEYAFSQTIETIGKSAAQQATQRVLLPAATAEKITTLPARPLILGGDDLTLLVRADLALRYAVAFINAFETESKTQLQALNTQYGLTLPKGFTACGGLAYVGAKQPFYRAYQLTEELCSEAKTVAKAARDQNNGHTPSALAFMRMTNLLTETRKGQEGYQLEGAVYATNDDQSKSNGLPQLKSLLELQHAFEQQDILQGLVKPLHTQMRQKIGEKALYERWRKVHPEGSIQLDALLGKLGQLQGDLPVVRQGTQFFTPLGDIKTLIDIHNAAQDD